MGPATQSRSAPTRADSAQVPAPRVTESAVSVSAVNDLATPWPQVKFWFCL